MPDEKHRKREQQDADGVGCAETIGEALALAEQGKTPEQSTLEEMDALWDAAKIAEKTSTK